MPPTSFSADRRSTSTRSISPKRPGVRYWLKRHFATANYRSAKALLDHPVGKRLGRAVQSTNLTAILLAGSNAPQPVEHAFMPPFARGHGDDELAAVANFVNGFFGNGTTKVTAADIDKARKACPRESNSNENLEVSFRNRTSAIWPPS
jgi:hypothetical protein